MNDLKNRILNFFREFFKDKYNQIFTLILLFSVALFIYYFTKTFNQALWYDEADYLNFSKYLAFGHPIWDLNPVRPILFSLIATLFFKIGFGEIGLRIFMSLFYLANVLLVYLIGRELFDEKVALISSLLTSIFWSHLFFSFRLLVDVPVLTFWLLSIFFFVKGYINNKGKIYVLLIVPAIVIGFFMKYLNALVAILIILYLLITERFNFLKNKDLLKSTAIGIILLIPFLIWQYLAYGSIFAFLKASFVGRADLGRSFFTSLVDHIKYLLPLSGFITMILFILGFIYILQVFLGLDIIIKNKDKELNKKFFLLLWIIVTISFAGKLGYGTYIEERYYFNFFIGLFLTIGLLLSKVYNLLKKYNKILPIIVILFILIFPLQFNLIQGDNIILNKAQSFKEVKEAGLWLREHLRDDEGYVSPATSAELPYHSERKDFGISVKQAFNNTKVKYIILSGFNPMPDDFLKDVKANQNRLIPVSSYTIPGMQQPIVLILEIRR